MRFVSILPLIAAVSASSSENHEQALTPFEERGDFVVGESATTPEESSQGENLLGARIELVNGFVKQKLKAITRFSLGLTFLIMMSVIISEAAPSYADGAFEVLGRTHGFVAYSDRAKWSLSSMKYRWPVLAVKTGCFFAGLLKHKNFISTEPQNSLGLAQFLGAQGSLLANYLIEIDDEIQKFLLPAGDGTFESEAMKIAYEHMVDPGIEIGLYVRNEWENFKNERIDPLIDEAISNRRAGDEEGWLRMLELAHRANQNPAEFIMGVDGMKRASKISVYFTQMYIYHGAVATAKMMRLSVETVPRLVSSAAGLPFAFSQITDRHTRKLLRNTRKYLSRDPSQDEESCSFLVGFDYGDLPEEEIVGKPNPCLQPIPGEMTHAEEDALITRKHAEEELGGNPSD